MKRGLQYITLCASFEFSRKINGIDRYWHCILIEKEINGVNYVSKMFYKFPNINPNSVFILYQSPKRESGITNIQIQRMGAETEEGRIASGLLGLPPSEYIW